MELNQTMSQTMRKMILRMKLMTRTRRIMKTRSMTRLKMKREMETLMLMGASLEPVASMRIRRLMMLAWMKTKKVERTDKTRNTMTRKS